MTKRKQRCWKFPSELGSVVFDPHTANHSNYFVDRVRDWAANARQGDTLSITSIWFSQKELSDMGEYDGD